MKRFLICCLFVWAGCFAKAQSVSENIIVITFDGLRWQELFAGADETIINDASFTKDAAETKAKFWAATPEERRKKLLPFIWSTVAEQGQIYGNRNLGNFVNVKNPYRISYPGYNEIFTGFPDSQISSNDKKENTNSSILGFLQKQPAFKDRVAAFASWDVFHFIFNRKQNGFFVNAGIDPIALSTPRSLQLNEMQKNAFQPFGKGIRPDLLTYYLAKEYLMEKSPRVLYIGFDDTDDWAHRGNYDYYLESAHQTDNYIADLWTAIQSLPDYKNKTTLVLATDHGRGDEIKKEWTSHGRKIKGSDQIWMMFLGKGITAKGEIKEGMQVYQSQLAQTIANLLGLQFSANHPVDEAIEFEQK